jgi:drug/metabolite transporter (DMT)-like permease
MATAAAAAIVGAESILALTPIAIKKSPLDPIAAIWSRVLTSGALGWLFASDHSLSRADVPAASALGYLNLLHVATSYESFRNLPAGQAMSILYTYPLWNLIFAGMFLSEQIPASSYGYMGLAAAGSVLLNTDPGHTATSALGRAPRYGWGLLTALLMALTESGMNTIIHTKKWMDPAKGIWVLNGSAAGWLAAASGLQTIFGMTSRNTPLLQSGSWTDAAWLTLFHGVTLFGGYWLRFFAIPRLSTVMYSILSYAGLLASYLYGLVILGERPGWMSVVGAVLIIVAGVLLQTNSDGGAV